MLCRMHCSLLLLVIFCSSEISFSFSFSCLAKQKYVSQPLKINIIKSAHFKSRQFLLTSLSPSNNEEGANESKQSLDDDNLDIEFTAPRWKMTCYDADDGIFGLDTQDPLLGVEIVKINIPTSGGLGLNLIEYKRDVDGRNMVLLESIVPDSNSGKSGQFKVGDTISFVGVEPDMSRTEGLGLDETLDVISKAAAESPTLTVVVKRLVTRKKIKVTFVNSNGDESSYSILSGSNLRFEMIKKKIQVYDTRTKRFDQPYITGDCAGEGICGTCLVECVYGSDLLNKRDRVEEMVTKKRPYNWRLSCRTIIGASNKSGEIKFKILPQKKWND